MMNTVKNTTYYRSGINQQKSINNQPHFKGGFHSALGSLESNPVLSLVIIDLFGMIIPRTVIDLKRNKEELGHLNWDAGRETILREGITSFLLFFLSGLTASGIGNAFLKKKFEKDGINTSAFLDFNTLEASEKQLQKIIEQEKDKGNTHISIKKLREEYIGSMLKGATSAIQGKPVSGIDEFKKYILNEDNIKLADINPESKNIKKQFKRLELHHQVALEEAGIADKIKNLFGESKIKVTNDNKGFSISIDNFVKNTVAFADDLILRPALEIANKINPNDSGNIGDRKINLEKFKEQFDSTFKKLEKFKAVKLYTAFFSTLALLIAFPRFNMWVSRKFTGTDEFPGVKGLSGDSTIPQNKKSGLFLFQKPEENR
ncbi:MAG: hypothetical protein PHC34_08060 [Candidatus Gastranaerophilales bacterium]|nr:hypothetical protein [Candidatus Gastranaerophilales bacterium]